MGELLLREGRRRRTSPRVYVGNVLRCCVRGKRPACEDLIADRRVVKLRLNRVTGYAADVRNRSVCALHTDQMSEGPNRGTRSSLCECVPSSEPASGEQCSTPRSAHAAGWRLSLVERRRESRARSVRSLRVGDGPSRFLGHEPLGKPETASIITRTDERREDLRQGFGPTRPKLLTAS